MQAADVELEKIGKRYGEQWVVRNIDLHIQRGEFFTFLGPSGCGKTTLLRIIAGFVEPDAGLVRLDSQAVNQVPPWRRDIGMVFQTTRSGRILPCLKMSLSGCASERWRAGNQPAGDGRTQASGTSRH